MKNRIHIIRLIIIFGILLSSFSFTAGPNWVWGVVQNDALIKIPQNLEEIKIMGKKSLESLPGILKEVWQDSLRIIKKIWQKIKIFWDSYIDYPLKRFWQKISTFFGREIKKRKEIIKEEFPKEKEELKKEFPEIGKSFWEGFKELIK